MKKHDALTIDIKRFLIYSILVIFTAAAFHADPGEAAGAENLKFPFSYEGNLSARPTSDAQIIFKKMKDSLELQGIHETDYELKYIGQTNSFTVRARGREDLELIKSTITDIEKQYFETTVSDVVYLQYANAKEVAAVLNSIYTPVIFFKAPPPQPQRPNKPGPAALKAADDPRFKVIKKRDENIDISDDTRTNSIVVTAPQNIIDLVKDTVQKIDRRTSLVHIKVLIAEITLDDTSQFGLEWKYAEQNNIGGKSVRQDLGANFANLNDPAAQAKLQGLKYSVIEGEKFSSFLQMLNSRSQINVMSSPQLLTTNNSSAYFEETIKVPTLQTTTTSTGVSSSSVEYQEIGIKLNVKPQVNRDEYINLGINQTIQNIIETTNVLNAPTFSHRLINTNVIAKNGSTVVISGFIKNNVKKSVLRSPLLERIPIVRDMMSRMSKKNEKTELMVFITPKIVKVETSLENLVEKMPAALKEKLAPVAKNYNDYEQETSEGRFAIIDVKDDMLILNGGKKDEIKDNDILYIFKGAESRAASGPGTEESGALAEAVIAVVKDKTSYARISRKFKNIQIRAGDIARWPFGSAEHFEELRQTGYKGEEFLGLKERRYVRTLTVRNITSAPINKAEASYVSMSPNLKYFMLSKKEFVPMKMVKKSEKEGRSYITVYFPRSVAPGEEIVIKTEDALPDDLLNVVKTQAGDPAFYSEMGRGVTRFNKTNMVIMIHHPYKIKIKNFDPEPVVTDNKMGGHSLIWTKQGRSFDASGKWRYENAGEILKKIEKD